MRNNLRTAIFALVMLLAGATASARMTDDQVVAYVKTATAQGKSQQQIVLEGADHVETTEQVERLKTRYEESQGTETNVAAQSVGGARVERSRSAANEITPGTLDDVQREVEEGNDAKVDARRVYGHSVFRNQSLSFEPNENVATPQNYRLGPGDEIVIDIWGASEDHIRQTITPEGSIMVSQIGPIYLNGMTIQEANNHIKGRFASKYAGVGGSEPESEVNVTLGQVRTIQVDLMGEVAVPGTYRLSPFSILRIVPISLIPPDL